MLNVKYMKSVLSFKLVCMIPNKKLKEGKKMKLIKRCASCLFICFSLSIKDENIALLGNPFKMPINIILAPLPLILNNG